MNSMKKTLSIAAMSLVVACGSMAAYAQTASGQDQSQPDTQRQGGGHGQMMTVDQRMQHMTQQLNLTSEQQQQIKPILENQEQQMQALHQDSSMSQQDRMTKMQSIHAQTISQIKPILNADQQAKFDQMTSHQGRAHGRGMGMGSGAGSGQQPPQTPQ